MPVIEYVNIATKAYQQAVKYESISKSQRDELFYFIHDWFRQVQDENRAKEESLESPEQFFKNSMGQLENLIKKK